MTSRPAMPESETPETDEVLMMTLKLAEAASYDPRVKGTFLSARERIEYLERRLCLAQTEIKGHMRVEDEMKAQLTAWQEHGKTYGFICGRFECDEAGKYHIFQNESSEFDKAQTRIAELEKLYQELSDHLDAEKRCDFPEHTTKALR